LSSDASCPATGAASVSAKAAVAASTASAAAAAGPSLDAAAVDISVDIASVRRAFALLFTIPDLPFQSALVTAVQYLSRTLDSDLRATNCFSGRLDYVNIFIIVMEIPALDSLEFLESAMPQFCKTVGLLPVSIQAQVLSNALVLGHSYTC